MLARAFEGVYDALEDDPSVSPSRWGLWGLLTTALGGGDLCAFDTPSGLEVEFIS